MKVSAAAGIDNDRLAAELSRHGVPFLNARPLPSWREPPEPWALLAGLAASDEARLRMAIIPLLMWNPELADGGLDAERDLEGRPRVTLMCYFTAAVLLQRQHRRRLADLGRATAPLPDLFSSALGLPLSVPPETGLRMLAQRHAELAGGAVDWLGTYVHAAGTFLERKEAERAWSS